MIAKLIALVVPLGLDTFAVCCALGVAGIPKSQRNRLSALMVAFEAGMPLVGVALGVALGHAIGEVADYVAIGVLTSFGLYTLLADDHGESSVALVNATGLRAVSLGVSISLDELAIGFTLGLLRLSVVTVIAVIAAQTVVITQLGMRFGALLGNHVRERAEQLAGIALITLAAVLLAEKLAT